MKCILYTALRFELHCHTILFENETCDRQSEKKENEVKLMK